jgi:hypothetical protein
MPIGKVNVYTCPKCGREMVTVDRDEGVTPFMLRCRVTLDCDGMAESCLYRPPPDHGPPMFEWYKPTEKQLKKAEPSMRHHAEQGGLFIRGIV